MAASRRNTITHDDAVRIGAMAAIAGLLAVFSGASPTGSTVIDVVLVAAFAAFVTWIGASAAWWALTAGAGLAMFGALPGPLLLIVLALAATAAGAWIGLDQLNQPILRAGIAALVVQIALRLEWNEWFLASAAVAALAMGVIVISGYARRKKYLRKRVRRSLYGLAAFATIAIVGIGAAAAQARTDARDGYIGMLDGLEFLQNGQVPESGAALEEAARDLDAAADTMGGPLGQLARFIPGIAQNRNGGVDVLRRASAASTSASDTLSVVDLDRLTVDGGVIDVDALGILEQPLQDLAVTVNELSDALHDADSPWLVAPFKSRLDDGIRRADQAAHQATATAATARIGPAILGANGPRRYLLAFVNAAEARGTSGLMGNWSELTINNGRLSVTASGRTADLQITKLRDVPLDATEEYLDRYAPHGARLTTGGTSVKFWSNVTMSADMPSVGNAMSQMYETATGTAVDGVFVIDAEGLASLLNITGSIVLPDIDLQLDGSNAEDFLLLGQYEFAENEREDLLEAVTDQTIDNVLSATLPPPQKMAPALAPAVLNGHISGYAVREDEQALLELVGMDASLPIVRNTGGDAIAVVNNNAGGNKIESFLERTIEYRPIVNERTGTATASLKITFDNTAPTSGFEEYVIGNKVDLPTGTNRSLVEIYTRLGVDAARLDGVAIDSATLPELGYYVLTALVDIPPGGSAVLELDLSGNLTRGTYELAYRPQPLPRIDTVIVDARTSGGSRLFDFEGELERRSLLSRSGVVAWR